MIVDLLDNLHQYSMLNPKIANGLEKLKAVEVDYNKQFEFDGGYLFFQTGTTTYIEEGTFEAHKKYMDIQIVLEGSEYIAWSPINELEVDVKYNDKKDVIRLNGSPKVTMEIKQGMAYICLPHDGHKALKYIDKATDYKKAVLKVEV